MRLTIPLVFALAVVFFALSNINWAQNDRAVERRLNRNERQIQRQINRADYFSDKTWQQLNPWIAQAKIAPLERAAKAVGNVADAADGRVDGRFGFRNSNPQTTWFYDYYTYTPTFYYGSGQADLYAGAIRYFDADQDGIYETHAYYRDSDHDGVYDEYSRLDFGGPPVADDEAAKAPPGIDYSGPTDARRHRVQGAIAMTKTAEVNGKDVLVVALKQEGDKTLAIDLGPLTAMQGKQIEVGTTISAVGPIQTIGEKEILFADQVTVGGTTLDVDRTTGMTLNGAVVEVTEINVGSDPHYMAVVEVDGQRQLVDLGTTSLYQGAYSPIDPNRSSGGSGKNAWLPSHYRRSRKAGGCGDPRRSQQELFVLAALAASQAQPREFETLCLNRTQVHSAIPKTLPNPKEITTPENVRPTLMKR